MTSKLAALGFVLACGGCILFVDPSGPFGSTCGFSGSTTAACGKCIATSCQSSVNACCADGSCAGHLGDLDTCGSTGACGALYTNAQSTAGTALTACLTNQCSSACSNATTGDGGTEGGTASPSNVYCQKNADGYSCTCGVGSLTIGGTCPNSSLPSTTYDGCCASSGWPKSGSCTCTVYECVSNGEGQGCSCAFGMPTDSEYAPGGGCTDPGTNGASDFTSGCCLKNDGSECYCGVADTSMGEQLCGTNFAPTTDCLLSDVACLTGGAPTSRCE